MSDVGACACFPNGAVVASPWLDDALNLKNRLQNYEKKC